MPFALDAFAEAAIECARLSVGEPLRLLSHYPLDEKTLRTLLCDSLALSDIQGCDDLSALNSLEGNVILFAEQLLRAPAKTRHLLDKLKNRQLNANIILVATHEQDEQLAYRFAHFLPLIPLSVNLPYEITTSQLSSFVAWVNFTAVQIGVSLTREAHAEIATMACRMSEENDKLSLNPVWLKQLLVLSQGLAGTEIDKPHVQRARQLNRQRLQRVPEESYRQFSQGIVTLDTHGQKIGQLNGLTVLELDDIEYGEPSRITATVFYGDGDIMDIERKADLGGNIHAKGMMILSGFISSLFAQNHPLHLSASIVFEQSYHEVDGDSASLAELCCLLSSMGKVPLNQAIAVTGAIDQFGRVQAVGGINQKIEGFARVCEKMGWQQGQAVIIPQSNLGNLNLSPEVVTHVAEGRLAIYAVEHAEQALALLTGIEIAKRDQEGYLDNTLYGRIEMRLLALMSDEHPPTLWQRVMKLLKI